MTTTTINNQPVHWTNSCFIKDFSQVITSHLQSKLQNYSSPLTTPSTVHVDKKTASFILLWCLLHLANGRAERTEWTQGCAGEVWQHCFTLTGVINSKAIKTRWKAAEVALTPSRAPTMLEQRFSDCCSSLVPYHIKQDHHHQWWINPPWLIKPKIFIVTFNTSLL